MFEPVVEVDQHPPVPQDERPRHGATSSRNPPASSRGSAGPRGHPAAYRARPRTPYACPTSARCRDAKELSMLDTPSSPSRSLSDAADAARLIPEAHGPGAHGAPPLPEAYGVPRLVLMVRDPRCPLRLLGTPGKPAGRGTLAHRTRDRLPGNGPGRAHRPLPGGRRRPLPLSGPGGRALLPGLPPRKRSGTAPGKQRRVHAAGASLGAGDAAWLSKGELSRWFHWQPGGPWSPGFDLAAVERWLSVQRTSSDGRFEVEVWTR